MWSITRPEGIERGAGPSAVFVRVAKAISDDIRRGALQAGDRLPSTRALATELGVNRNTVVAAYDELAAEGWIETDAARASVVSLALPDARPQRFATAVEDFGLAGLARS